MTMLRSIVSICNINLSKRIVNNSLIINCNTNSIIYENTTLINRCLIRTAATKKRRKTHPYHWWAETEPKNPFKTYLDKHNVKFLDDFVENNVMNKVSPLKTELFEKGQYEPNSIRCGLIAKKIGHQPMWTKTGRRLVTTVLQIVSNNVVSYKTNEEFIKIRRPFYNFHSFKDKDVIVVGAENSDPRNHSIDYLRLFEKANLPPKKKLTRFFVTPNAKLAPGTPLSVNHFRVGDYVDVFGKTRDYGFQGVIRRWKFKGQLKHNGVTKAHRRPGTIARGRKLMGPLKGTKMAGHMGSERRVHKGLKVWRINTKYNVMWVHGPGIPGGINSWVYVFDTTLSYKKYKDDDHPPFPTYYEEIDGPRPENIYDQDLHPFDEPSLLFEETEEEKKAALAALRMTKKAKIAKIR